MTADLDMVLKLKIEYKGGETAMLPLKYHLHPQTQIPA